MLVLGTILSVFSWVDYFNQSFASIGNNIKNLLGNVGNMSFDVDTDPDKDGLSNLDETYWNTDFQNPDTDGDGFLDGEETASGHDPTKPGPDDLLRDINLTDKLAELTTAGLAEGSLKPDSTDFNKSLTDLAQYATDNASLAINNAISPSTLHLVDPTKDNQDKYLTEMYDIIDKFLVAYGNELNNLETYLITIGSNGFKDSLVINYFSDEKNVFTSIYNKAGDLDVPKNWQTEHVGLMGEIKIAIESNRAIIVGKNDPVKATIALNSLVELMDHIPDWSNDFIQKNRDEKINNALIESLSK